MIINTYLCERISIHKNGYNLLIGYEKLLRVILYGVV